MTARVASLLLIAVVLPLATASAQERSPTPSAKELWKSYPLQTSPTPQAPTAQPARSTPAPPARAQGRAPLVPLLLLGVGLGLAAAAVPELRRRRRPAATPPPESEPARPRAAIAPPNPHRAWTAVIEWHETCFRVTTRPPGEYGRVLAESGPLAWPPADPAAVQALSEAAAATRGRAALRRLAGAPARPRVVREALRLGTRRRASAGQTAGAGPRARPMTGWTRRRLLRAAAAGGAIAGGGAALTAGGGNTLLAAPSVDTDARILNFFLLLEYVQEALLPRGAPAREA